MSLSSTLVQNKEAARVTEVSSAHEILFKACEELGMVVADLETRLHPVLAQRVGDEAKVQSQPEPLRVPVAQMLYERSAQVCSAIIVLRSILERLEV